MEKGVKCIKKSFYKKEEEQDENNIGKSDLAEYN